MTTIKPAVDLAARAAVAARTEELFRASGALREGHFQLKSGRHADAYVEKFAVLADPAATSELVSYWVAYVRGTTGDEGRDDARPPVELVAGPTTGGVILAFETARRLRAGRRPWEGGKDHTTHETARLMGTDRHVWLLVGASAAVGALLARSILRTMLPTAG